MTRSVERTLGCVAAAVVLALSAVSADRMPLMTLAQTKIIVDDHRPLAAMVRQLEKDHGWMITYEDPPYEHQSQMVDVTTTVRRTPGRPVLVPRRGFFAFQYHVPPIADADRQILGILQEMVSQYSQSGNDGNFAAIQDGGVYHVVPTVVRRRDGMTQPYASMLDVVVMMPESTGTVLALLTQLVATIKSGGERLELGVVPMAGAFDRKVVRVRAAQKAARAVLVDLLRASGLRVSWQLLCQPGVREACYLNLHEVRPAVQ